MLVVAAWEVERIAILINGEQMSAKKEKAAAKFLGGYNCAQSILSSFCAEFNIDENTALKISCGFGGGMARQGEVCGAVAGGIMVLGLKHGRGKNDDNSAKEITYAKIQELMERFSKKHGTYICRNLLNGCDLTDKEGQKYFKENDLNNKICKVCVESVVEILESIR
jgi:C_GCAxxG_C_C family probable redox protein